MTSDTFQRKLTAILSADVVGYSRLMGEDEAGTVKTLEIYKGVMFSLIKQHRGRVVDSPGDNLLAEFGSVVDAVQCAVSIQKELQTRNADLSENRRMEFRIGINLGDVIEEEDRIYGDGVNIAARLEALADPGGICVSKTAFDHIESKLPLGYEFLGDQTVKNIPKPIGAYRVLMEPRVISAKGVEQKKAVSFWRRKAVLSLGIIVILIIVAVLYWNFYLRGLSIEPSSIEPQQAPAVSKVEEAPKTIAVLPFDDLSPEKDQEYFVLGLSEEILNSLAQIPNLTVKARTSSFSFKSKDKTIQEIASLLGVNHVLEGSVSKDGDALRIITSLIRVADSSCLWTETYDRQFKDIFAIREEIANSVADELKLTLGIGEDLKQLGGTDNEKAYELYLVSKGYHYEMRYDQAIGPIETALMLDPDFALAWALKSDIYSVLANLMPVEAVTSTVEVSLNAALRAIKLEPDLGQAYFSLGKIHMIKGEFIKAKESYQKGMELSNRSMDVLESQLLIYYYDIVGYLRKCYELLEKRRRNDPLDASIRAEYMLISGYLGDIQGAEDEYERGKELFGDQWTIGNVGITLLRLSPKNVPSINEIPAIPWGPIWNMGRNNLASPEKGLAELRRIYSGEDTQLSGYLLRDISTWAAYFGDSEFAMDAMEKSVSLSTLNLLVIWAPVFQEIRQLPRFKEFVKEIGLVDYWNKFGWPDLCRPVGDDDFECD
jgi:adenylate cyclase